jgi:hypothetical protein
MSLDLGVVIKWKMANITPVRMQMRRSNAGNELQANLTT